MSQTTHPHPGGILKSKLRDQRIPFFELADRIDYDENIIKDVIDGKLPISPRLSIKLAKFFKDPIDYWLKLQINYELGLVSFESSYAKKLMPDPMSFPLPDRFG